MLDPIAPNRDVFILDARDLRSRKGWTRERITDWLREKYGDAFNYSSRTVAHWYDDLPSSKPAPFDISSAERSDAPFLARLDLLKRELFKQGGLTDSESQAALTVRPYFHDSADDEPGLFAQLAVVDAHTRGSISKSLIDEIQQFLAYAPWTARGRTAFNRGVIEGWLRLPYFPMLTESTESTHSSFEPSPHIRNTCIELGLPAVRWFDRVDGVFRHEFLEYRDATQPIDKSITSDRWQEVTESIVVDTDWRMYIVKRRSGEWKPNDMTAGSVREEGLK
jgi:hypothetical protein